MKNKLIIILFCAFLLAGAVWETLLPDKYYSEREKRLLTQVSDVLDTQITSGKMASKAEKYLTDQFPQRDVLVALHTLSERLLGKQESNHVFWGRDHYLIECFDSYNEEQYQKNIDTVKQFTETMQRENIPVRVMLIPTAVEILSGKLPAFATHASQRDMFSRAEAAGLPVVDTISALEKHKEEYIYYRTDHHYTSLGAYYCYAAWKQAKGEEASSLTGQENGVAGAWKEEVLCDDFFGTTYNKVNAPFAVADTITAYYRKENHEVSYNNGNYETDSIYERKYLEGKDQYAVFLNSNQATTVVKGDGEGKLLIIKDSYANCFAQFVVGEYEETHMLDLRFYKNSVSDYIRDNGITEVLFLYSIPDFAEMNLNL